MRPLLLLISAGALVLIVPSSGMADEALARTSTCLECHSVDQKNIGPSFRDIASKYKDDPSAQEVLTRSIEKGSKGHWTKVSHGAPMPPFAGWLSHAEIERLVRWVLKFQN